jgi:hypothetical protein
MAYAQWIEVTVQTSGLDINIQNAHLAWGKFHEKGSKDRDISSSEINNIKVSNGGMATINSCGHSNSASGTEGAFDVYDATNLNKIGTFSWECPWGYGHNTFSWSDDGSTNYIALVEGGNTGSSAIGCLSLIIEKKG